MYPHYSDTDNSRSKLKSILLLWQCDKSWQYAEFSLKLNYFFVLENMTCNSIPSCLRVQEMTQMAPALVLTFPINSCTLFSGNYISISNDNLLELTLFDLGAIYFFLLMAHLVLLLAISQLLLLIPVTSFTPLLQVLFQILLWLIISFYKFSVQLLFWFKGQSIDQESGDLSDISVTVRVILFSKSTDMNCHSTKWCY